MALQNRVTPFSELIADPARGLVYGNRGCLHDDAGRIRRHHDGKRWIACRLRFKDWHREPLMRPGRFTELFFLDEMTAFAAGHRPCALCRRGDYVRFTEIWRSLHPGPTNADTIDARLHRERLDPGVGRQRKHEADVGSLPDGTFVERDGEPFLVLGETLMRWTPGGYRSGTARPAHGAIRVATPPSLVEVLRSGWNPVVPSMHPSTVLSLVQRS
jgi:hypothetical protein